MKDQGHERKDLLCLAGVLLLFFFMFFSPQPPQLSLKTGFKNGICDTLDFFFVFCFQHSYNGTLFVP